MKRTKLLLAIAALGMSFSSFAQVKIGDNPTTINPGSVLELESTNKGLLMPRISLTNTTTWGLLGTPAAGMHVYNTNTGITSTNTAYPTLADKTGEYYWDGTGWVALARAIGCASFEAYLNRPQSISVRNDWATTQLVADTEVRDISNAYNPASSEYTVPVDGFYMFQASANDQVAVAGARHSVLYIWSSATGSLANSTVQNQPYGNGSWHNATSLSYLTAGQKITIRMAVIHASGTAPLTTWVSGIKFSGSRIDCTNN